MQNNLQAVTFVPNAKCNNRHTGMGGQRTSTNENRDNPRFRNKRSVANVRSWTRMGLNTKGPKYWPLLNLGMNWKHDWGGRPKRPSPPPPPVRLQAVLTTFEIRVFETRVFCSHTGEHPRIAILAGTHLSDNGFGKPTQQNPMCRLIDRWTQPGHPEQHTYTCDVLRNATAIDIIAVGRIHSSLTLHEVKVHCAWRLRQKGPEKSNNDHIWKWDIEQGPANGSRTEANVKFRKFVYFCENALIPKHTHTVEAAVRDFQRKDFSSTAQPCIICHF